MRAIVCGDGEPSERDLEVVRAFANTLAGRLDAPRLCLACGAMGRQTALCNTFGRPEQPVTDTPSPSGAGSQVTTRED